MIVYVTDHPHSQKICRTVATGAKATLAPPDRLLEGPAAVYGILRGCDRIIKRCEWVGRDYYHVDHGYFRRGHYDGYYRISRNGLQFRGVGLPQKPADRWQDLKIPLKPWQHGGKNIIVCPISKAVGDFMGIAPARWLDAVTEEIAIHTDRPILIKPKDGPDIRHVLCNAWCLVTHASNAAIDALVHGVPVFTLGPSAAAPFGLQDLSQIEKPLYGAREPYLHELAYQQWTLNEIRRGECWDHLE